MPTCPNACFAGGQASGFCRDHLFTFLFNAFHADLDRTVTAQTQASVSLGMHGAPSLPSRAMTVSAVASRSSYSQAY